jgi:hypothetical protein
LAEKYYFFVYLKSSETWIKGYELNMKTDRRVLGNIPEQSLQIDGISLSLSFGNQNEPMEFFHRCTALLFSCS